MNLCPEMGRLKLGVYLPDTCGLLRLFCSQLFAPSIAAQFSCGRILYLFLYLRLWYQIEKLWNKVNIWKLITKITFLLEIRNSILHNLRIFLIHRKKLITVKKIREKLVPNSISLSFIALPSIYFESFLRVFHTENLFIRTANNCNELMRARRENV